MGSIRALFEYVKGEGKDAPRSRRYAERINVGLGPRREDWAAVATQYQEQAKADYTRGDTYRDQYYKRAGNGSPCVCVSAGRDAALHAAAMSVYWPVSQSMMNVQAARLATVLRRVQIGLTTLNEPIYDGSRRRASGDSGCRSRACSG